MAIPASASSAQLETLVFVHGYNTNLQFAQKRGLQVYQKLLANCADRPPVRYVIWAWRSEREFARPIVDYRVKSKRATSLADKFAWTLNMLGPKPAVVIGYSLGAQVAVSSLTQSFAYKGEPVQLAVIGAANDCGFASGECQLKNPGHIRRTFIFLNRGDRAVRAAGLVCKARFGQRFKFFDELAPKRSQFFGQVKVVDITRIASNRHSVTRYIQIPQITNCIRNMLSNSAGTHLNCSGPLEQWPELPAASDFTPVEISPIPAAVAEPVPVPVQ